VSLLSAQSFMSSVSAQKDLPGRALYDNDDVFNQLSSAFQTKLELRFGKKSEKGKTDSKPPALKSAGDQSAFQAPLAAVARQTEGPLQALLSALANPLVNDPTTDLTSQDTQSETAIVLGSGMNVIAAFNDSGSYTGVNNHFTGFSRSTNMGSSWTDMGLLSSSTSVSGDAGDPVLARSSSTGTVFLSTLGFDTDDVLQIFRSTDDGLTFLAPVNGAPGLTGSAGSHDKEWITVDNFAGSGNGNVYLFWRNFGTGGGMTFTRSTDDGLTWGPSGGTVLNSGGGQGAFVTVGTDHSVYAFWYHSATTPDEIRVRKSTDQGVTFAAATTVTTLLTTGVNGDLGLGFRSNAFPHAAVNPVNGNIYVVYDDNPAGADRGNIFFRQSTDGGATWSAATQLNTDATTNDQWMPTLAVTPDGSSVAVAWYDRRRDPANSLIETWGTIGAISGGTITFGPNFRISSQFPAVYGVDPVIVSTYMGDYDMMTADNTSFYYTWGDNRDTSIAVPSRKNANVRFAKIPVAGPGAIIDYTSSITPTIDPNECNDLVVTVTNNGTATATMLMGTLTTSTPDVTISSGTQSFPDLAPGASGSNLMPFQISTSPAFVCGTAIDLTLTMSTGDVLTFSVPSGSIGAASRFDNSSTIPLPDLTTTDIPIVVSGFAGVIGDVDVSFYLTHTFDADLDIFLIGPDGTTVELSTDNGSSGDNYGSACSPDASRTTLDDSAATAITAGTAPFVGTFRPEGMLSAFNGKTGVAVNGTWTLRIIDDVGADVGTHWCSSLFIAPLVCTPGAGGCGACTITCPTDITQSNDPGACGATVSYAAPTTAGSCGTVTCSPASGSFFPVGTTTVTCTTTAGPSCSFNVTVNDTEPPTITCPPNQTACAVPGSAGGVVTYPAPTATDNCPGVTTVCVPPSGSSFPVGTSTVTCTATDAAGNSASCSFTVTVFDALLQDDYDPNIRLMWMTSGPQAGMYRFCCGSSFTGVGKVRKEGSTFVLEHNATDRRVIGRLDATQKRGSASLQVPPGKSRCTITDRNTADDLCICL
jgi:subtilisin-like proprotein convertase family protein